MITAEQIGPVHKFRLARTILGRAFYFTAAYWVDGLLVDTGCLHTVKELIPALEGLRIDRIVNTHSHEDHIAGNAVVTETRQAEILAHPLALPFLENPRLRPLRPYQVFFWGYPTPSSGKPIGGRVETERHQFEVVHTPGHSPDHVCLFEPRQGWLFAGDAYVGGFDRTLRADYHIWPIIESLKTMAALQPGVIFPGSGTVRQDAGRELANKIQYLEEMGEKVLELHEKGWSYTRIRAKLFGPEMLVRYITSGHFSGKNLVRSYVEDRY